ncbi:GH3 auxin-responsive promoter family protein [Halobacteriovorax sp. HLS]|uniref:GH3 family domain-containing protein n=1 Tax=Halobacteriovorax sp. HLS TaxID=2234000 RepID=UPI000FDAC10E|nr:GH3 auxin-responsive promoter family protein [Halobacteriovorax sp. HLS]
MLQRIIWLLNRSLYIQFERESNQLEETQRRVLKDILESNRSTLNSRKKKLTNDSYEEFKKEFPPTNYSDWKELVELERDKNPSTLCEDIKRFQGTSGSTESIKWIPYNSKILNEFDQASSAWIYNLGNLYPGILKGKHYWSLSWVPDNLKESTTSDDKELLPFWKKHLMSKVMVPNPKVVNCKTSQDCFFTTLVELIATQELSLISVWSPTFAINLINMLIEYKETIYKCFQNKSWQPYRTDLEWLKFPESKRNMTFLLNLNEGNIANITKEIWPNLTLISCWDTSTSKIWADKLQEYFKHCSIQGKGIWATEAVITIPINGKYPLAYRSHFYEFECIKTNEIIPSWGLKEGMKVSPVITTGNGIYRYKIEDILVVSGYLESVPCFKFIGRKNTIDMVGEKIDSESALIICKKFNASTLLAIKNSKKPYYILLTDNHSTKQEDVESTLRTYYHYNLARDLNQIGKVQLLHSTDPLDIYYKICDSKSSIKGNIKIEPLKLLENIDQIEYLENLCRN